MSFTADDILGQLDDCARRFEFPMLDNGYVYLVDTRLHALRDEARWALVIEVLGYDPRAGGLSDVVFVFGNCVGRPGLEDGDFLERIGAEVEDEDEPETVAAGVDSVEIRGVRHPVADLAGQGLELLFRSLVPQHRDALLADDDELHARVPADLPLLLRLEAWRHPDLVRGELPSATATFRSLAEALVHGDPGLYRPEPPNTHWSNWPEGGSM